MLVQDQTDVFTFLADPSNHAGASHVECIETHISAVFLAGDRAYKLKRAVHLPYADFSTPEIRLAACEKEFALNKKTSPEIYVGFRPIFLKHNQLTFEPTDQLVDAVVEMRRFDQKDILDHIAVQGNLTVEMIGPLAREIVKAHRDAPSVEEDGVANIQGVLDINRAGFDESRAFPNDDVERLDAAFRSRLQFLEPILERRANRGCIKRCHGDLHLRNICMYNGRPQLFDCIDFNDQLATVDVLYDLSFLAMDLWHRGLHEMANLVVNLYLDRTDEEDGFACMPFFIALRAAVRAHVLATQSKDPEIEGAAEKLAEARSYYDLAMALLRPNATRLIAIGGFSGSGKSTIAVKVAPLIGLAPGARMIESDRLRKSMFGVEPEERLPESAYAPEVSDKVYAKMSERAEGLLIDGCPVITDAVFDKSRRRVAIEAAARRAQAPFDGIWLQTSTDRLKSRIKKRPTTVSDATLDVLDMQLAGDVGENAWASVSTSGSVEETVHEARGLLSV